MIKDENDYPIDIEIQMHDYEKKRFQFSRMLDD